MAIHLSIGPWGETLAEFVAASQAAEAAGFVRIWNPEMHRSPFVPLAAAASATSEISIATGIALAFNRSPMNTALTSLDLDEISDGRFVLGLGTGVRRLNEDWHNATFGKPVAHLQETIEIIRALWAGVGSGETVLIEGEWERIRLRGYERPFHQQRATIPIYVASMGPMLTRLAGRIGDGWVAHELGSPEYLAQVTLPELEHGLRSAGRNRSEVNVVASACCVVHPDGAEARRRAAGLVAFYASVRSYTDFFAWHGFGAEAVAVQDAFRAGEVERMLDAVSPEMVDALTLAGTADQVRSRLRHYDGLADEVKLTPPTHHVPEAVTREAQSALLETFSH